METTWNKKFSTARRWALFPTCALALMATCAAHGAQAEQLSENDKIVISSADRLSDADMDNKRGSGGTTTTVTVASNQSINSTSTGNTVNVGGNLSNGSITTGNGFGGSGFGSFVMNTGNNSTINSGVSVSILMMQ